MIREILRLPPASPRPDALRLWSSTNIVLAPRSARTLLLVEHDWSAQVEQLEQEGEDLLGVVSAAAAWASRLRTGVRRVVDVGSGPGVGTCELARHFPEAHLVAVDASKAMLQRVGERSEKLGLGDRVTTHMAEVPGGLHDLAPADIVCASMSLHHLSDPDDALGAIRHLLEPDGLLIVIEHGPGHPRGHGPRIDANGLLVANGYEVIGERVISGRSVTIARPAQG